MRSLLLVQATTFPRGEVLEHMHVGGCRTGVMFRRRSEARMLASVSAGLGRVMARSEGFESRNGHLADWKGSFHLCPTVLWSSASHFSDVGGRTRLAGIQLSPAQLAQAILSRETSCTIPVLSCSVLVDNHPSLGPHRHPSQLPSEHRFWEILGEHQSTVVPFRNGQGSTSGCW